MAARAMPMAMVVARWRGEGDGGGSEGDGGGGLGNDGGGNSDGRVGEGDGAGGLGEGSVGEKTQKQSEVDLTDVCKIGFVKAVSCVIMVCT